MNVENNSSDSHILGQYLEVINGQNRNVERTQVYSFFWWENASMCQMVTKVGRFRIYTVEYNGKVPSHHL